MTVALDEIKELLRLFMVERIVYIIISIIAFFALMFCAIYILLQDGSTYPAILGLFLNTGGIGYSIARLLRMWSDALNHLQKNR